MLKTFGLSIVVYDATFARVTIMESPIHMVTLSRLVVQVLIPVQYHSRKSTERRYILRYQVPLKEVDQHQNLQKPARVQAKTGTAQNLMDSSSSQAIVFPGLPCTGPCLSFSAMEFRYIRRLYSRRWIHWSKLYPQVYAYITNTYLRLFSELVWRINCRVWFLL